MNITGLIQRFAKIIAVMAFFILFIVGLFSNYSLDLFSVLVSFFKASIGGLIFWIIGVIISDIILKGLLESIDTTRDNKWEGGLLTRFVEEKEKRAEDRYKETRTAETVNETDKILRAANAVKSSKPK